MSELSRPLQVVLVLALAFAGLWFVALRPKNGGGSSATKPPAAQPAKPAPKKSSLPGGLGRSVDKANAAKRQGDAAAAASERAGAAPESGAPSTTTSTPATAPAPARPVPPARHAGTPATRPASHRPPGVTPGMVRRALGRGDAVVLLFWGATSSDDRAVRSELGRVDRRGGHVHAWPVSVRGLSRFKNVLLGIDVLQSPSVVVLARGADPRVLAGYTDHAEIDQATLLALLHRR